MSRKVVFKTYYQDFEAIDAAKVEATINQINDAQKGKVFDKKVKQKPSYNLQTSTNNQYITNYTLEQTTADTTLLKHPIDNHIKKVIIKLQKVLPQM